MHGARDQSPRERDFELCCTAACSPSGRTGVNTLAMGRDAPAMNVSLMLLSCDPPLSHAYECHQVCLRFDIIYRLNCPDTVCEVSERGHSRLHSLLHWLSVCRLRA